MIYFQLLDTIVPAKKQKNIFIFLFSTQTTILASFPRCEAPVVELSVFFGRGFNIFCGIMNVVGV